MVRPMRNFATQITQALVCAAPFVLLIACGSSTSEPVGAQDASASDGATGGGSPGDAGSNPGDAEVEAGSCAVKSAACQACIDRDVKNGSAFPCFDRDATCISGRLRAIDCACDVQMGIGDAGTFEACFAHLDNYGNHGTAARAGYETVCGAACR